MYQFFKTMQSVANTSSVNYKSIMQLTKDIALSGGYSRGPVQLKNGKIVERTKYINKFDDVLVAKWFIYYKKFFTGKLSKHPELQDFYVDIIGRTFIHMMRFINLDKLASDSNVTSLMGMSFSNRIGEVLIDMGSQKRLEKLESGSLPKVNAKSTDRMHMNKAVNYLAVSMDSLVEDGTQFKDSSYDENSLLFISVLKKQLSNNPYGNLVLDTLLYSNEQIDFKNLSNYIKLKPCEKTPKNLFYIHSAINTIVEYVEHERNEHYTNFDFKVGFGKESKKTLKCDESLLSQSY